MLRRLFSYWQTAKRQTVIGGILLVVAAAIDLLQPWPIKWLVDYVFGSHTPPAWLGSILPVLATDNMAAGITAVCISILVLALLHRSTATFGHFFLIRAGANVVQQVRCHACDHLHRLSLAYHDRRKVGDSLYRVAYDSHAAQSLLNGADCHRRARARWRCDRHVSNRRATHPGDHGRRAALLFYHSRIQPPDRRRVAPLP
jgi:ABC-type multidrug transport system fused ATPase/permease subunit